MDYNAQSFVAAITGLMAHMGYFVRGEHHLAAARIAGCHLGGLIVVTAAKYHLESLSLYDAIFQAVKLAGIYCGSLLASILIYREFLSPIRHIPGPVSFRLTKLSHFLKQYQYQNFEILEDLRHQYGDVVRTGPDEVTLFGSDAYRQVHGRSSQCTKAPYYDLQHPLRNIISTRDFADHDTRRKVWQQAFSSQATSVLEKAVYDKADLLVQQLGKHKGNPVNISDWMEWFTFDLMGEVGLGLSFTNLESNETNSIVSLFRIAHKFIGPFAAVPWLIHLFMGIPYVQQMGYYKTFLDWANQEATRAINEAKSDRTDLIAYIIEDARKNGGIEANMRNILADFLMVFITGSDTVRGVIPIMIYHLLNDPEGLKKLKDELTSIDIREYKELQQLPYLSACIYETLRLHPPVPSAALRLAPPAGLVVAGKFIPEGTTIATPQYSLFQDDRNFVRPADWIPERFSTRPELILDNGAFVPWTTGRFSCLGKSMSLMELRVAIALIFTNFDIEFAPGENGLRMLAEISESFTTAVGPMQVVMKARSTE